MAMWLGIVKLHSVSVTTPRLCTFLTMYSCQIKHKFRTPYIFEALIAGYIIEIHEMMGRVLRKTVVSRIAAGIFTRRFFRMEPGGLNNVVNWVPQLFARVKSALVHFNVFLGKIALFI